jgi:hypothetical protein
MNGRGPNAAVLTADGLFQNLFTLADFAQTAPASLFSWLCTASRCSLSRSTAVAYAYILATFFHRLANIRSELADIYQRDAVKSIVCCAAEATVQASNKCISMGDFKDLKCIGAPCFGFIIIKRESHTIFSKKHFSWRNYSREFK